jgi:hypothetical protein
VLLRVSAVAAVADKKLLRRAKTLMLLKLLY